MRYQRNRNDGAGAAYQVFMREELAAEFSYHTEEKQQTGSRRQEKFYLDTLQLMGEYARYDVLDAVLQFIQYKCWKMGMRAVYLKISSRNLFYVELYKKFGFCIIADERKEIKKGAYTYEYVMKYQLPKTLEEAYDHYIRRK